MQRPGPIRDVWDRGLKLPTRRNKSGFSDRRLTLVALAALLVLGAARCQPAPAELQHIVLLLDVSASMADPTSNGGAPKIEEVRQAVTAMLRFFAGVNPIPRVSIVVFNNDPEVLYPLTNNMNALAEATAALPGRVGGGSNIGAALEAAIRQLEGVDKGVIVLISDGAPTQGLIAAQVIDGPARKVREQGHCFYTLLARDFGMSTEGAAFLQRARDVAPCPEAEKILPLSDTPRLLWAISLARQLPPGVEMSEASGRLEPGESFSVALVTPGPRVDLSAWCRTAALTPDNLAEVRVVAISTGAPVQLSFSASVTQPWTDLVSEGVGLSTLSAPDVVAACSTLGIHNPSDTKVAYYVMIMTLPRSVSQSDSGAAIALVVAVAGILGIGLAVIAVERFRPRPGAYLADAHTGARYALPRTEKAVTSIGSAPGCAIVASGPNVAPRHAVIRYGRGRYFLQDQAGAGRTLLNGAPVDARPLVHGDRIKVGDVEFLFRQEEREARATSAR